MQTWLEILNENPLCLVFSGSEFSLLPLMAQQVEAEKYILLGHAAKKNPILKNFQRARVILLGPHAYVSPTWYEENDVPTWNYVMAEIEGNVKILRGEEENYEAVKKQSDFFEPGVFYMPTDLEGKLSEYIQSFEIQVDTVKTKLKLSQNRSLKDRENVIEKLEESSIDQSVRLADWMRRYTLPKH